MKATILLFFITILFLTTPSCKKDFLNKTPDGDINIDQVFSNPVFAEQFLTNTYSHLPREFVFPDNGNGVSMTNTFTGAADEMEQGHEPSYCNRMNDGTWSIDNATNVQDGWSNSYQGIRKANIFIENIDKLPLTELVTQDKINKWKGEATFLRAYYHFLLIRMYGPVPIIDKSIPINGDFLAETRQPIDKCVDFIVNECNKAAEMLNVRVPASDDSQYGRPTKITALALKARALLFMASPLWNGNADYAALKQDGLRLFPDFAPERWKTAATAAKACIDQAETAGHKLYKSATNDPILNYQELFYTNWNDEVIWVRTMGGYLDLDVYSEPRGMPGTGFTLNAPTQNIVDDYEMANGERPILGYNADMTPIINSASGYVETGNTTVDNPNYVAGTRNMYVNREPRFYASIMFTGQKYKPDQRSPLNDPLKFWKGAPDGRATNNAGNYSETGYLMKKFGHPSYKRNGNTGPRKTWILFRLGEQYLNYAEALNESDGPVTDVYKYVNLIRNRSGLPNLPSGLSKDQMREKIWHERRIELAFETNRYFDTHRWKIAADIDSKKVYGIDVNGLDYNMSSDAFYKRTVVESRVFTDRHYLWPIPQYEIQKNIKLTQNPGW
ncbi:RagB/SusD family nutrient uptake outer membrane protein [Pedobacter sp. V48]|uniref:RagB/SusD family nutrient uptake outer membrane protein n=1 Tax=Pedobacter sp. V48 TaxID=509635 RepID=UPI0003E44CC5|nr:RagB/SusD family nutrient uptake outer membrane protein [Pedobacter sp. V48]ETZ23808.1 hypothetical protein N824_20340 [Pedobacter sp. V48]